MPEPNKIRKIAAGVTAHYEILSAGLSMVRKEMAAGFADTREALVGLRREVGSVQGDVESMQGSLGSMQGSLESMQGSIARLAHQQDERAARIDHVLDETLEKSRRSMADLSAAFEVVARQ